MSDPASQGAGAAPAGQVSEPEEVVRAFLGALERLDVDAALRYAAPEILYHNKGMPPARGIGTFERQMRSLPRFADGFEARIHHLAANGPIVLTERTDVIQIRRFRWEFWVCGTFEVRDGRIVLWRDYFDYVNLVVAAGRGLLRLALDRV